MNIDPKILEHHSNYIAILRFYETVMSTSMQNFCDRRVRCRLPFVPLLIVEQIISDVVEFLKDEPPLLTVNSPVMVIGDLCGHLPDLLRILSEYGFPDRVSYIFLGNYVDNGPFTIETVILVFTLKILWPTRVFLLRGVHEFKDMCQGQDFARDITSLYQSPGLFHLFMLAFAELPYVVLLNRELMCVSGGIGLNTPLLQTISDIKKPSIAFPSPAAIDVVWSDPTDALPMFLPNSRGYGNLFGAMAVKAFFDAEAKASKIQLKAIIRGRQPVTDGCLWQFDDQVLTVYTASSPPSIRSGVVTVTAEKQIVLHSWNPLALLERKDVVFVPSESENIFFISEVHGVVGRMLPKYQMPGLRLSVNRQSFKVLPSETVPKPTRDRAGSLRGVVASKMILQL